MSTQSKQTTVPETEAGCERIGLELDTHAVVFREGDKIFRAIKPGKEAFMEELLGHPAIQKLMEQGQLLRAEKSSRKVPGHSLILEQPVMSLVTYPFEWPASMFKKAAMSLLELNIKLMESGFCTSDGQLWNVLFDGTSPRFIDFSSIVALPANQKWLGDAEFDSTCLNTLRLMEKGYPTVARKQLREVVPQLDAYLASAVIYNPKRHKHRSRIYGDYKIAGELLGHFGGKLLNRFRNIGKKEHWRADLPKIKKWLAQIETTDVQPTKEKWSDYYTDLQAPGFDGSRESFNQLRNSTPKFKSIAGILERIRPRTVIDLACNRGLFSQLAALAGARVVGVDTDEQALDWMYRDSVGLNTCVQPVFLDVMFPAEAISLRQRPFPSAHLRLRSECAFALALIHHLAFGAVQLKFPQIAAMLADWTSRYLIFEFVPMQDALLQRMLAKRAWEMKPNFDWYTLENCEAELRKHFRTIERLESHPSPRVILFCQDKISPAA